MNKHATVAEWAALSDRFHDAALATDMATPIPLIWGTDAVHGHNNVSGATLFPHNIGLGAAHDPALIERIGRATARQVRATAMECLSNIASHYYLFLAPYVKTIFELTAAALAEPRASGEEVAIRALDFWANVCECEADAEEKAETHSGFAAAAAPPLVPLLLTVLPSALASEEELDEDTWDLSRAAALCLTALSRVVGDPVQAAVMPFVQQHVSSPDWRRREAAVTAFGALLDCPAPETVLPIAAGALTSLLGLLKDPSLPVRRSAAYCLGIMFETLHLPSEPQQPQLVPAGETLANVLGALTSTLASDDVRVADSAIWALDKLVQAYGDLAEEVVRAAADGDSTAAAATPLSPFFKALVEALLRASERPDASKLRLDAYDALCDTLQAATQAEAPLLAQLVPHLLGKLAATWETAPAALSADAVEAQAELQGLLCGVLMVITSRLSKCGGQHKAALVGLADAMMMAYLRVFSCRSATVHGEALLAVSSLIDALGESCSKYMAALQPVIELGLKNCSEAAVCANTVTLVGDICRALEASVDPFADHFMTLLLQDLSSNDISTEVKPLIITVFGDMALALGDRFLRFLPHVTSMLGGAAQHSCSVARGTKDQATIDANNELRAAILEAYSGILQGLKDCEAAKTHLIGQSVPVADFVGQCYADGTADDGVLRAAVGALGDLACMPNVAPLLVQRRELVELLRVCHSSEDASVREAAAFADGELAARTQAPGF
jgi:importin subunit beta-1